MAAKKETKKKDIKLASKPSKEKKETTKKATTKKEVAKKDTVKSKEVEEKVEAKKEEKEEVVAEAKTPVKKYTPKYKTPTMEELLDAGAHFGHQVRRWNPNMEPYIFAQRMGIHVIDLEQTEKLLKEACDFLYKVASEGGQIVFVGTKRQAAEIVRIEANRCGALFITERWLGGTITNYPVIKKNMDKLIDLRQKKASGALEKYTKKEQLLKDREMDKLDKYVGGILNLKGTPAALFVVDARREKTAIKEAKRAKVPVVSLLDTNSNPKLVDYVIPGNDDAIRSIVVIVKAIGDAIEDGYKAYAAANPIKVLPTVSKVLPAIEAKPVVSKTEAVHVTKKVNKVEVEESVKETKASKK